MVFHKPEYKDVKPHPFTLSFDGQIEGEFFEAYLNKYIKHMRFSMFLGIIIWGLFGILDAIVATKETFFKLMVIRYVLVWPVMFGSVIISFMSNVKKYIGLGISVGILACALGVIAKSALVSVQASATMHAGLIVIFIYGYAIMRARFIWASLTGLIIVVAFEFVAIFLRKMSPVLLVNDSFFLLMANFIGMYVCYSLELFARRDFIYSKMIQDEKDKTEEANEQLKKEIDERIEAEKELERHRDNLEKLVRDRTKELDDTQHEIVYMLGNAAEYRDNETGQHIKRMSRYCVLLARAMGMDEKDCDLLYHASQMHDIGKIGVPDSVLLKPGRLDPDEWNVIITHTTIGAEILSGNNSKLCRMASLIALTHHEKWDGTGYPNGLKGEQIPLIGRIVCLCDVFDALISKRPYKNAWTVEDTVEEIERLSGKFFDPVLVKKFKEILPDVLLIKDLPGLQEDDKN